MLALARAMFYNEFSLEKLHELTRIDCWFLYRMRNIIGIYKQLVDTGDVRLLQVPKSPNYSCNFSRKDSRTTSAYSSKRRKPASRIDKSPRR